MGMDMAGQPWRRGRHIDRELEEQRRNMGIHEHHENRKFLQRRHGKKEEARPFVRGSALYKTEEGSGARRPAR